MQWDAWFPVPLPIEGVIDHDRLGNAPCVIAEILSQIFVFAADDVAKHFVRPVYFSRDRFRIRIEKKFRAVESQTALRIVRTRNAKAVQLARSHIRQKHMPDLIGMFGHWNTNIFLARVRVIEQTKIDRGGGFGKKRKVDPIAQPCCAKRIWITKPSLYRSHKRAAFLSNMDCALAIPDLLPTRPARFPLVDVRREPHNIERVNDLPARPFL